MVDSRYRTRVYQDASENQQKLFRYRRERDICKLVVDTGRRVISKGVEGVGYVCGERL